MKKNIILTISLLLIAMNTFAQSLNALNYSGTMYVSKFVILSTPRYVSFEDHAILSEEGTLPVMEVTKIVFDFENNNIVMNGNDHPVKVTSIKKYDTNNGWAVVLYIDFLNERDKYELVWPESKSPYLQTITKEESGGYKLLKMNLSTKPYKDSEDGILLNFLNNIHE